jgi:DtxR family Mn-dependent transcriptional regulator
MIGLGLVVIGVLLFWPNGGLVGWWQRSRRMTTRVITEDALKHIEKADMHGEKASLQSLAGELHISTSQAADLVVDLQKQELLGMDAGKLELTPAGHEYALQIIRAHRLWEHYLAQETGFAETDWHLHAEDYEHRLTPEDVNRLAIQLGNPTHDPHGDPIPTAEGEMVYHGGQPLTAFKSGERLQIVHLEDEPEAISAQLAAEELHPGLSVRVIENSPRRMRFWAGGDEHILAPIVAANISAVPVQDDIEIEAHPCDRLNVLKAGEKGEVVHISPLLRGPERRRMMDLGILPGTVIEANFVSPSGDPMAYTIRGAMIALRSEQANYIHIKKV